jgi:hypothetical protein
MSLRPSLSVLSDGTSPLAVLLLLIFFLMKNVYKSDERDVFKGTSRQKRDFLVEIADALLTSYRCIHIG